MPARALKIVGVDQETNLMPDRAEVTRSVVTEHVQFAAPRGFLPAFD